MGSHHLVLPCTGAVGCFSTASIIPAIVAVQLASLTPYTNVENDAFLPSLLSSTSSCSRACQVQQTKACQAGPNCPTGPPAALPYKPLAIGPNATPKHTVKHNSHTCAATHCGWPAQLHRGSTHVKGVLTRSPKIPTTPHASE